MQRVAVAVETSRRQTQTDNPTLLAWTAINRARLRPDVLFDLSRHRYLIGLYLCTAQDVVVKKAGQIGVSEWLISYALHCVIARKIDILYLMPTGETVSDLDSTRFRMAIEASPYLSGLAQKSASSPRSRLDHVGLKRFGNNVLYLRSASVRKDARSPKLKAIPIDGWIGDEYDEMDPRAPELARKRMGHSDVAEERIVSTPTYVNLGIDAEWEGTTQATYFFRCACGHRFSPTIHHLVKVWDDGDRPVDWWGKSDSDAWIACPRCSRRIDRYQQGEWVAAFPDRPRVGYHISKLIAPFVDLRKVVTNLQTLDQTKRKEAWNQDLGEAYSPKGTSLSYADITRAKRSYSTTTSYSGWTYMGIDVGTMLHIVIRTGTSTSSRLIWAGVRKSIADVVSLIRAYSVRCCVIDALPETRFARDLQDAVRTGIVWISYYDELTKRDDTSDWSSDKGTVMSDRTRSLDDLVAGVREGSVTMAADIDGIEDYVSHLTNEVRVVEKRRDGRDVARWVRTGADHYLHAENYCRIAMSRPVLIAPLVQGVARRKLS